MEMIQNENFLSNDYVNQEYDDQNFNTGKIKRYNDLGNDIPKNINIRSQMNTFNSYSNMNNINNIPQNQTQKQNKLKFQDNQKNSENNNPFLEKEIIPDRTMSYFYGNNFLTDAILKTEEFEIPFHKIVLCSASDFIYNYFTLNKNIQEENQKSIVNLPEIMKSSYSRGNKKECLEKIIKYCYYNQDIKSKLLEVYPEFVNCDKNINFDSIEVHVKMIPQIEYRQHDIKFDNEMTFLEYFNSEKASVHKKTLISKEILENAGFEDITQDWDAKYHKEQEGLEDYKTYRIWTDKFDKNPGKVLKLDIDNGLTNSGRLWHLHIDNCDCCSIGSADLDNVWQFNMLMEIFGSKFRL
jgi:hypothetical protein